MRVMIVDDHAGMRQVLRSLTEGLGYEAQECAEAAQAVVAYRRSPFDWVLMDIAMKPTDGLAATRQLLALDPGARVVIVSEHGNAQMRHAARQAGACGFVLKSNLMDLRSLLLGPTPSAPPPTEPNRNPSSPPL